MRTSLVARRVRILLLLLPAVVVAAATLQTGCAAGRPEPANGGRPNAELKAGGLYSVDDGDGFYRVVKILVLDEDAAHIAIYANKFSARPRSVDPASLTFGGVGEERDDVGIMHLPLAREAFARDRPVFISQAPVTEDELEGYRMWREAGGEVFP